MTPHRARRRAVLLLATAAALVVTGCTAEKKDDAKTGSSGAPAAPPAPKVAPGVTADSIKIGITYPDLDSVKQFVNIDHGPYEAAYNALIKKINDAGGINGRKIVPVFGKINLISPAAAQETCVKLTQDEKVFAVLGNFNGDEPLCYVQTNKTAAIGGQLTAKRYAQAQAPWFSDTRGGDEVGDGMALFNKDNGLAGKKVAVLSNVNEQAVMKDTVIPALQKLGITPVETGVLDAPATDAAAIGQQTGVFIQKFQASGVDTIVVVGSMGASFPQVLEQTKYRPRLLFTDNLQVQAYANDKGKHDFTTLANAAALGLNTLWSEAANQECMNTVEAALPDFKGKLTVDPASLPAGTPTPQIAPNVACRNLALFKAIADKAGKDLSYETFQNAGFTLGAFQDPGNVDKATYAQATPHGAIPARLFTFDTATQKFAVSAS
ncbi:ABC transporter substrate-binding protein [Yinghuangia seranimata]|uniref:ABC transporter substrate-binding protein n=1 Tax=Yinghuangia seranimata TaxID=408067 RepID=UPI00248AD3C0|nr:ABC transporter substrate-binding protein [Yinghuangia seranimata]MDI2129384.1 ABC transporter substrate-binding protein [Yinghuangia seranimata]